MFPCSVCNVRFTEVDVKEGNYFPSTGVCKACYKKMGNSKATCFGKKKIYDPKSLACSQICSDERLCKIFIHHPEQF